MYYHDCRIYRSPFPLSQRSIAIQFTTVTSIAFKFLSSEAHQSESPSLEMYRGKSFSRELGAGSQRNLNHAYLTIGEIIRSQPRKS